MGYMTTATHSQIEQRTWRGSDSLDETTRRRWLDGIEAFGASAKTSPKLTATRVKHVRRFALWVKVDPWHVTSEHVSAWHDCLSDLAPSTQTTMRGAVAAFYRWGYAAGRSHVDPTQGLTHKALRLGVPDAWEDPLIAYERFLWSQGMSPATIRSWVEQLRTIARGFPSTAPFEVTTDDLFEWMAGQRWARETRRGRRTVLRSFYAWACDTERVDQNPARKIPKVKGGEPVARPATDAEYAAALATSGRWELALRLAAELGMRRGEVAVVHTSDLEEDECGMTLTVHGKGSKVRRLPVPPRLALTLRGCAEGYLFPGRIVDKQAPKSWGGHVSARYLGREIAEILPRGVTMHALRHRFATNAYNLDRDVFTVQRVLGHASPATTQRYVKVSDATMRALVDRVNAVDLDPR